MNLYHGDCLEILPTFPPASVEAIITDLPYGTTACEWDSIIPLAPMWEQVKRVLKVNGVFISTSSQPFTSALIMSNPLWFKYEWIWEKPQGTNPMNAESMPLKSHENILVFSKNRHTYNKQMERGKPYKGFSSTDGATIGEVYGSMKSKHSKNDGTRNPKTVLFFSQNREGLHPTQKPVSLYEYLVRTYTNAGETVLDICMGSGTTGVAAIQTGRKFIGIEKEQKYFEIASRRIAQAPQPLFTEPPRQPTQHAPDAGKAAAQNELFE